MKQTIILRSRFIFDDYAEVYQEYRLLLFPFPTFFCNTSMLITDAANLYILKQDFQQLKAINPSCRFVVITEWTKFNMLSVLFPGIELVRADIPLRFSSIVTGFLCQKPSKRNFSLLEREEIFLSYMSCGLKDEAIAISMNISIRTVKRIKEGLLSKTGLNSSNQLAVFSILNGIQPRKIPVV